MGCTFPETCLQSPRLWGRVSVVVIDGGHGTVVAPECLKSPAKVAKIPTIVIAKATELLSFFYLWGGDGL